MAYSNKIHGKAYRQLIVFRFLKKIGVSGVMLGGFVFAVLHYGLAPWQTLFGIILIVCFLYRKLDIRNFLTPSWEGIVVDKTGRYTRKVKYVLSDRNNIAAFTARYAMICTIWIQRDRDGKIVPIHWYDYVENGMNNTVTYFRRGDRVRHHAFLPLVEKEDKSKDRWVLCLKCQKMAHKYNDVCHHCGMPVLK